MLVPKLRFKREDGTDYPVWEEQNLLQALIEKKEYNTLSSECPLLTSSRTGLMYQNEYRDNASTSNQSTLFSVVYRGDCTYRHMSDDSIFHFNINTLCDKGLVSKEYPVFTARNEFNLAFVVTHLNSSTRFLEFCRQQKKGGTRTRLYFKTLCNYKMAFPCLEEQQKIADFLSTVDEVIIQSEAEVQNLEQQKKAAMQKIFSQEVRFKREDGSEYPEWEAVSFGSLIKEYRHRTSVENEDVLLSSAINGMFLNTELFGHQRGKSNIGYLKIDYGTLILSAQNLHLGNANVNLRFEHGIISPAYKTYHITNCNVFFMAQWIKREETNQFFYDATTVGASQCRRNVDWNALYEQRILLPHIEEQQKIADFLSAYDEAISYAKQELEHWKQLKKGLLQQMFV